MEKELSKLQDEIIKDECPSEESEDLKEEAANDATALEVSADKNDNTEYGIEEKGEISGVCDELLTNGGNIISRAKANFLKLFDKKEKKVKPDNVIVIDAGEVATGNTHIEVKYHTMRSVEKYRYLPAVSSIFMALVLLVLVVLPVGKMSALLNDYWLVQMLSAFGVVFAAIFFACGVYRLFEAARLPFEKHPACFMVQVSALCANLTFSGLILSYGVFPDQNKALLLTIIVEAFALVSVLVYVIVSIYKILSANTFVRRVVSDKIRCDLENTAHTLSKGKKIFAIVMSVIFLAVLVLSLSLSVVATGGFSAEAVLSVDLWEDTEKEVIVKLGNPDETTDNIWYYYSDSYKKLKNKLNKAIAEDKDTAEIEKQIDALSYSVMAVEFENGKTTNVYLNNFTDGTTADRTKRTTWLYSSTSRMHYLEYFVKFDDGSCEQGLLMEFKVPEIYYNMALVRWEGKLGTFETNINHGLLEWTEYGAQVLKEYYENVNNQPPYERPEDRSAARQYKNYLS